MKVNGSSSSSSSFLRAFSVLVKPSSSSICRRRDSMVKSASALTSSRLMPSFSIRSLLSFLRPFSRVSMRSRTRSCTYETCFPVTSWPGSTMVCLIPSTSKTMAFRIVFPVFSPSSRSRSWPAAITGSNKLATFSSYSFSTLAISPSSCFKRASRCFFVSAIFEFNWSPNSRSETLFSSSRRFNAFWRASSST